MSKTRDTTARRVYVRVATPSGQKTIYFQIPGTMLSDEDIAAGSVTMAITGVSTVEALPPDCYFDSPVEVAQ